MRHRKAGNQLGRNSSHRRAMLRNIVTSLFTHEQIETTDAKAKALRPVAEKMIGLAKRGDLHARRQALAYFMDKAVTHRLFDELKDRYLDRQGGYLRILKKGTRKGDGAPVSIVQLLPLEEVKKPGKKKTKRPKAGKGIGAKARKETARKKGAEKDLKETVTETASRKPEARKEKKEVRPQENTDSEKK